MLILAPLPKPVNFDIFYGRVCEMGLRGPKAIDVERLKAEATAWATFFYNLRDGQPGLIRRIEWKTASSEELKRMNWYNFVKRHPEFRKKPKPRTGQILEPSQIILPASKAARDFTSEMKAKGWEIWPPLLPAPELWEQLKQARSVTDVKKASHGIRKWIDSESVVSSCLPGFPVVTIPDALDSYAQDFLTGMKLPSYAKTDRPLSDDKRVNHLAKVLAGARLGLAPITAAKRLSHWSWPADWARKEFEGIVADERQQLLRKS